jgi:hypothetical protein
MSYRGSFVTEYINCNECYKKAKEILTGDNSKYLCGFTIGTWIEGHDPLPIIAGKIGDTAAGRELSTFEDDFLPKLEDALCHPLKIVFIPESEDPILVVVNAKN